jgi:hypothetical protein
MRDIGFYRCLRRIQTSKRVAYQGLMAEVGKKSGFSLLPCLTLDVTQDFRPELLDSGSGQR